MRRHKSYTDELPFNALRFDQDVQRATIAARVKYLARHWNLDDVGVITVSKRRDGYYVIDGQHRVRAGMELGLGDTKIKCLVYSDLTRAEEARKFLTLNDSSAVSAFDKFQLGLVAEDEICLGIKNILDKYGVRVSRTRGDAIVCCIGTLLAIAEREDGLKLVDDLCAVITETWGTRAAALEGLIFSAMSVILGRYDGQINLGILTQKLAKYRGGPAALLGDAKGLSDYRPITVTRAAAQVIVDTYNRGRRSGQLAPL